MPPQPCPSPPASHQADAGSRAATPRPSASDSDSEYGSPRKKRKLRANDNDYRISSSRGGKVPNYKEEGEDFGLDDDQEYDKAYYAQQALAPAATDEEQHEIEMVINHFRDEDRKGVILPN